MTELRDRIAEIIDREVDGLWDPLEVAAALITALDLQPEWGCPTSDIRHGCRCSRRYTTQWETEDRNA